MDRAPAIEIATAEDLPEILALANWAAVNTAANFATEPELLVTWIEGWQETRDLYPWVVARDRGRVVGFAKASPHRARGAYRWTAEVSVYVHHERHGCGIGRALYRSLIPTLRAQGFVTLLAGIAIPNPASERLHAALGFGRCGTYRRAGWKLGQWHDVGYWELHLVPAHLAPDPIRPVTDVWPRVFRALVDPPAIAVRAEKLCSEAASSLICALDDELSAVYPEPGATHFRLEESEVAGDRGAFVVAYLDEEPAGCGAVRVMDDGAAELKRIFVLARWRGLGLSKRILVTLEEHAERLGADRVLLETGLRQGAALVLYEGAGYARIPPFGEYIDSPLSICMQKRLQHSR